MEKFLIKAYKKIHEYNRKKRSELPLKDFLGENEYVLLTTNFKRQDRKNYLNNYHRAKLVWDEAEIVLERQF
jgi:hypothetical protein